MIKHILYYTFILMLTMGGHTVYAQSKTQGGKVKKFKQDPRKEVRAALKYAESIFNDSISKALSIVEENLFIAINKQYKPEEALSYSILGQFNQKLTNYSLAISNFEKANQIYKSLKDQPMLLKNTYNVGTCYFKLKAYKDAIVFWQKSEQVALDLKQDDKVVTIKLKIGQTYLKTPNYMLAQPYFEEALAIARRLKNEADIVEATIGLGKIEELKGADKSAEQLYTTARKKAERIESDELTNSSLNSLSNLYQNQQNYSQTVEVQQEAYDYNAKRGNSESALYNSTNLANTLVELGDEEEAIEILNESAKFLEEEENSFVKRNFYKTMSDAYAKQGDLEKAAEFRGEYDVLIDSFKILENQKQELITAKNNLINFTENKILLLEKDREINEKTIQLLQQEQVIKNEAISRQKTITYILILGLVIIAVMAFFIYRNNKQKQISNQLLTLKSLRNQMNPHFIFNSLNSVNGFIAQKDERSANKYLSEFSKLMRAVLEYSQNDFIPLSKEIEILELYLNLEHFRFSSHFDYKIDYPKDIDLEQYQIPPMLLQPFIENAIWHGLRYKEGKGILEVRFRQLENAVEIRISDNGIGREQSKAFKTANQKKMKSTGIKNVKDRLEIIKNVFQKELTINIADLDPVSKEGTAVTIELFI